MVTEQTFKLSGRKVAIGLSVVVAALLLLFAWQAWTASRALISARDHADVVQQRLTAGDFAGANRELDDLKSKAHTAHSRTSGPLWDLAKHIPYFGRNVGAVQTVAAVLDTATRINAPIALQLTQAVDEGRFKPVKGQFDLAEIHRLTPSVEQAAESIANASIALDKLRPGQLIFPFNDLVGDLQDQVDKARASATATGKAFELMPQMLGETSPRSYLLVIQNPAELRSTGGLPGSISILHADRGKLTMGWQGSAASVNGFTAPAVKLPKDTEDQYGPTMATDFRDLNLTPDFPEAAQIARAMVARSQHVTVDGVVSIDPIAMAGILAGTGPVTVTGGVTLTAANAVPLLTNQTYQSILNPGLQDSFFASAARNIFNAVTAGQGNQDQAIKGLATGANEHRVLLWSANSAEEAKLANTAVAGDLTTAPTSVPHVGLYFNDATAAKADFYLNYRASVAAVDCRQHGAQDYRATVSLSSKVPASYSNLSVYVLGDGTFAPRGTIAVNLRLYAPYGGSVTGMEVDGVTHSVTADKHEGRQVAFLPVSLKPGQQVVVTADIQTGKGQTGTGVFDFTPGMNPAPNGVKIDSACN
ncbi:MAG: hypothetical protein JWP74_1606 [Marmoricola sp.]|nr:hypothetical protein [Marmoricola sp.]